MKTFAVCLAILALALGAIRDTPAETPKVSAELQNKLLKAQLASERLSREYQSCVQRNWTAEFQAASRTYQSAIDEAFTQAKLDKKDWDLNLDSFEFVKKAPPPKPEEKKP